MTFAIAELAAVPVTAFLAAWLTDRFSRRQRSTDAVRAERMTVASDLYGPLRELQSLLRKHGRLPVTESQAASAFHSFYDSYARHRHRLPDNWLHLSRSVRAAAGTALGAVAFVDLDPTVEFTELAEPDGQWRDYADDYIDYLVDRIMRWAGPGLPRAQELAPFDPWLVSTGRRESWV
jgi:hypothetical protein